jgi:hypothetical protein
VTLKGGDLIYRADQKIEYVYFPEEAVVAMIDSMDDGRTVEVGINIFLGGIVTPDKAIVQFAGGAMKMKAKDLRKEMRFRESAAAVTSDLRADVSCGNQPIGGVQLAPPNRAAPGAPAAHHERLCGIRILQRPRLLKRSCECHRFIRQQYKQLLDELPRLLSRQ